jgi:hypothetical protein
MVAEVQGANRRTYYCTNTVSIASKALFVVMLTMPGEELASMRNDHTSSFSLMLDAFEAT